MSKKVKRPLKERFMSYVDKKSKHECWPWLGGKGNGTVIYGRFQVDRKSKLAHGVAYKIFKGEKPKGLTIDHICNNGLCVNPNHLRLLTLRENILRGNSVTAICARKTECIRGHKYTPENTKIKKARYGKQRLCRVCSGKYDKKYYLQNKWRWKIYEARRDAKKCQT